jgi:hypothetical protein
MMIRLNDLPVLDVAVIPIVYRLSASAAANNLHVVTSGWDSEVANLQSWYMA